MSSEWQKVLASECVIPVPKFITKNQSVLQELNYSYNFDFVVDSNRGQKSLLNIFEASKAW